LYGARFIKRKNKRKRRRENKTNRLYRLRKMETGLKFSHSSRKGWDIRLKNQEILK
jgi:hypothetical protein